MPSRPTGGSAQRCAKTALFSRAARKGTSAPRPGRAPSGGSPMAAASRAGPSSRVRPPFTAAASGALLLSVRRWRTFLCHSVCAAYYSMPKAALQAKKRQRALFAAPPAASKPFCRLRQHPNQPPLALDPALDLPLQPIGQRIHPLAGFGADEKELEAGRGRWLSHIFEQAFTKSTPGRRIIEARIDRPGMGENCPPGLTL